MPTIDNSRYQAPGLVTHGRERRLLTFGLALLTLMLMVDPSDQLFHTKTPFFAAIIVFWILGRGLFRPAVNPVIAGAVVLISAAIPLLWVLIPVIAGRPLTFESSVGYPKAFLFLTLLFVLCNQQIDLALIASRLSILLVVITIAFVILSKASPLLFKVIYAFALDKNIALITEERDQFGIGVGQYYYLTCPLMLFGLGYFLRNSLWRKRRRWTNCTLTFLFFVALVFTGARANLAASLGVLGAFAIWRIHQTKGVNLAVALACLALLPLVGLGFRSAKTLLNPEETSNQVKLGHYRSYVQEFGEHPIYLLTGQGEGTGFYSSGFNDYTNVTELSFLELIRQFGIPVTCLLASVFILPFFLLWAQTDVSGPDGYLAIPYAAYLFVCATNPLLVSSTGMLVVVMVWARALRYVPALNCSPLAERSA